MRVGSCLSQIQAYRFSHGGTYIDSITHKPRQFDFRAVLELDDKRVVLAIECKNLPASSPLVICGCERRLDEATHDFIDSRVGRFVEKGITSVGASSATRRASGTDSFYLPGNFVGKSLLRLKKEKYVTSIPDADVYDRWAQALSSSIELAFLACLAAHKPPKSHIYSAVLPLVVVPDGSLWRAAYNSSGEIEQEPVSVNDAELYVGRNLRICACPGQSKTLEHDFCFSHVHFLTMTGLKSFISKLAINANALASLFTDRALQL